MSTRLLWNPWRDEPAPEFPLEPSAVDVHAVHSAIGGYAPTPLVSLPGLARALGIGALWVKDESRRFGMKAFKALGASYALYRHFQDSLPPMESGELNAGALFRGELRSWFSGTTFASATDGNHGRAVAWAARQTGHRAVIFVPAATVQARVDAIRGEGATVVVVDGNYDDAVLEAKRQAELEGWQILSDTSWPGYERIPSWISAGYFTLFYEIDQALVERGESDPDVVFVQGGVGAFPSAAATYLAHPTGLRRPRLVSVEPHSAACLLESAASPGGKPVTATGAQDSIMAGLNCGRPSDVAWPLVRSTYDLFMAIDDEFARESMRRLYHSVKGDTSVTAGESGAAGLAGLLALLAHPEAPALRQRLGLGPRARVLVINTEGDTDPVHFRQVVQAGPVTG